MADARANRRSRCGTSRSAFPASSPTTTSSLDLREGEVHALLGENGAGKSTLMNILYGLYHPDEGEIEIRGKPVRLGTPSAAIDAGVGMVHQHFMLIPVMTVAENIVLAHRSRRTPASSSTCGEANERVAEISERFGLAVDPRAKDRGHHRRAAAARRDPEGAVPQRGHPRRSTSRRRC